MIYVEAAAKPEMNRRGHDKQRVSSLAAAALHRRARPLRWRLCFAGCAGGRGMGFPPRLRHPKPQRWLGRWLPASCNVRVSAGGNAAKDMHSILPLVLPNATHGTLTKE